MQFSFLSEAICNHFPNVCSVSLVHMYSMVIVLCLGACYGRHKETRAHQYKMLWKITDQGVRRSNPVSRMSILCSYKISIPSKFLTTSFWTSIVLWATIRWLGDDYDHTSNTFFWFLGGGIYETMLVCVCTHVCVCGA